MRFLLVDRILERIPGERICGIKHITADDYYLVPDGQGKLCFAPSLIGESLGQLAAWDVMAGNAFTKRPVAGVVASACLHRTVYPGETLMLESFIDSLDESAVLYHSRASSEGETVFTVEGALGPLLPMQQFIDEKDIRLQFAEIDRPGCRDSFSKQGSFVPFPASVIASAKAQITFDGIAHLEPGESVRAVKHISRQAPYFPDHFPLNPVLPLTILLECKISLAKQFLQQSALPVSYQIKELRKIKMSDFVHPGDILHTEARIHSRTDDELILKFRSEVDGRRVCVLDMIFKGIPQ